MNQQFGTKPIKKIRNDHTFCLWCFWFHSFEVVYNYFCCAWQLRNPNHFFCSFYGIITQFDSWHKCRVSTVIFAFTSSDSKIFIIQIPKIKCYNLHLHTCIQAQYIELDLHTFIKNAILYIVCGSFTQKIELKWLERLNRTLNPRITRLLLKHIC